jgi:hypothetical protein
MNLQNQLKVVSNFFLDGAKIIFGSLVVGVFVPSASGSIPWLTFAVGLAMTIAFLAIPIRIAKIIDTA